MRYPHKFSIGLKAETANYSSSWMYGCVFKGNKQMIFSLRTRCPDLCCLTCHWSHWIHLFSCQRANPGSGLRVNPIQDPVQDPIQKIPPLPGRTTETAGRQVKQQHSNLAIWPQPDLYLVKLSTWLWPSTSTGLWYQQMLVNSISWCQVFDQYRFCMDRAHKDSIVLFFHQLLSNEKRNKSLISRRDNILSHI